MTKILSTNMARTAVALALLELSPPIVRAAENLLPPFAISSSQHGSTVLPPWRSSDGVDSTNITVRLGSPDEKKDAVWIELHDASEVNTANARLTGLPKTSKGLFSFEIFLAKETLDVVAVSLGTENVAEENSRLITWKLLPDGTVRISSRDELLNTSLRYKPGIPQKFRCEFDLTAEGGARLTFFVGEKNETPAAEVHLPGTLPPIDGLRTTSTQRGTNAHWLIRDLVLTKD